MNERVSKIKAKVTIKFNSVDIDDFVLYASGNVANIDTMNYINSLTIKETLSSKDVNPVGNVSSNSISITLTSTDRKLVPDNVNSDYYGYMNDKAVITIELIDGSTTIPFGRYFVNSWINATSSSSKNNVTITASDVLDKIKDNNINLSELYLKNNICENIVMVIEDVNSGLNLGDRIVIDTDNIVFSPSTLKAINIDNDNVKGYLNNIGKSTLTNICIGRENELYTDFCCDDVAGESVCSISENTSIESAKLNNSSLLAYDGICVKSSKYVINESNKVLELSEQTLISGTTRFEDISLSNVFKINFISVTGNNDNSNIDVKNIVYSKKKLSFEVDSNVEQTCEVTVYGQTINESFSEKYVYADNKNGNNVYTTTNNLLNSGDIDTYANNILALLKLKANGIEITGSFNPRIKLSDTVYVDCTKILATSGYYKVVGLNWSIASKLSCVMTLIKVNIED